MFFDIDGVIRRLDIAVFGKPTKVWDERGPDGKGIVEIVSSNPEIILKARKTKYCGVLYDFQPVNFLTVQPPSWRPQTEIWLKQNLPGLEYQVKYAQNSSDKLKSLNNGQVLVEDCPNFQDFSQIILVDRPYNRTAKAPRRVKSPEELLDLLNRI